MWDVNEIEVCITAFTTLIEIDDDANRIILKDSVTPNVNEITGANLERRIFKALRNEIYDEENNEDSAVVERVWNIGNELQMRAIVVSTWAVPVIAMTHRLEEPTHLYKFFEKYARIVAKVYLLLTKIAFSVVESLSSDEILTPQGFYTELVSTYNMASALIQYIEEKKDDSNSSSVSNEDETMSGLGCDLEAGIPLPTRREMQKIVYGPLKTLLARKQAAKLLDMMVVLKAKQVDVMKDAKVKDGSLLADLIDEAWEKYENCKLSGSENTLKEALEQQAKLSAPFME
ncbi:hypothetical protein DdX_11172 [Ditylenchus destructor]|uniref:Uncharacterized protein n=1 Tax=Ditylenchus destructor TaxID=166010 RepID=A0AAD4MWV7_9BILA|nr:hypothetical protein DdX_11172 [Ditylenchus destructor]